MARGTTVRSIPASTTAVGGSATSQHVLGEAADIVIRGYETDRFAGDRGSAYTSLGTLYFKVPGWPVGFGDEEKAEELLRKALAGRDEMDIFYQVE